MNRQNKRSRGAAPESGYTFTKILLITAVLLGTGLGAQLFLQSSVGAPAVSVQVQTPGTNDQNVATLKMIQPRYGHQATTLPDGRILITGGLQTLDVDNPQPATINEIFDPVTGVFSAYEGEIPDVLGAAAAESHTVSVSNGGTLNFGLDAVNFSWQDIGSFIFQSTPTDGSDPVTTEIAVPADANLGALQRAYATATPLTQTSIYDSGNAQINSYNRLLIAGGVNNNGQPVDAAVFNPARLATDKNDYAPGEVVWLTGAGWKPNEEVNVWVVDSNGWQYKATLTADANGRFPQDQPLFDVIEEHLGVTFDLTAIGADSDLVSTVRFTDSRAINSVKLNGGSSVSILPSGVSITVDITVTTDGVNPGNRWRATGWSIGTTPPAAGTLNIVNTPDHDAAGTFSETFSITGPTTPGTYNAYFVAYQDQAGTAGPSSTFVLPNSVVVSKLTQTISFGTLAGKTFGDADFNVSATASSGLPVSFSIVSGPATITGNSVHLTGAGTVKVRASQGGNATYKPADDVDQSFDVAKATATINVSGYSGAYDGNAHGATGTATGVGGVDLSASLNLGSTFTDVPGGTANWSFNAGGNYNTASGSVPITISKANATINVTGYSVTYDGNNHTATGTATGVGGADLGSLLDLSGTTHKNAGNYPGDAWHFAGNGNYNSKDGTVDDAIAKANATIVVTPYSVTYDATAHTATGTAKGIGGVDVGTLDLSDTTHTGAGDYLSDSWSFTDAAGNYNDASGTVHDSIAKADATIVVTPYSVTYDATAHTATGTAKGIGGVDVGTLDLSGTTHTGAGDYPSDSWSFTDAAGNYNDASGTVHDSIAKADATIVVTPYSVIYDATAHTATGTAKGIGGVDVGTLNLSGTTHTGAGDYPSDSWSFTDAAGNYNDASGTVHDSIAKADATIVVAPYSVTYDATAHTATGTAKGIGGVDVGTLNLSGTTHTGAGDYPSDSWSFTDAAGNYNDASGAVHDSIAKADATITVNGYTGTYDANAHGATGTATGVGGVDLSAGLSLGSSFTDVPGGTANWSFTGGQNYNDKTGAAAIVINKANATINVSGYTGTYDGNAHGATGTATGVGGVDLSAGLNLGATFVNVPGGAANWTFNGGVNYCNKNGSVAIVINKANPTITVNPYTVIWDGNSHSATGSAKGVQGETLAGLDLSGTAHTLPGIYTDSWTFTDVTGNYCNKTGTVTDTINYKWGGFFQPVDNIPTVNRAKAGSAIPVKFTLYGDRGLNIFYPGYPKAFVSTFGDTVDVSTVEQVVNAANSGLTYDATADQYIYVWKTDKTKPGKFALVVKLIDGTEHVAYFDLTK